MLVSKRKKSADVLLNNLLQILLLYWAKRTDAKESIYYMISLIQNLITAKTPVVIENQSCELDSEVDLTL